MTRRRLLLAFTAIFLTVGSLWWSRRGGLDDAAARLVDALAPDAGAARLGAAALEHLPAGSGARHLVVAIAEALGQAPEALAGLPVAELRQRLQARIQEEHLAGDTLSVQGWELSFSEARLYALASLAKE